MALNGHSVGVALDANRDGIFVDIGGIISNSFTLSNSTIDISSKNLTQWRNLMDGEGLQTLEINVECIFSTNVVFRQITTIANQNLIRPFQIDRDGEILSGNFYVQNYAETSPDNDKLTATFTLVSDGAVTGI